MTTKTLAQITRSETIITPKGPVTVTGFQLNSPESFTSTKPATVTVTGTLNGRTVRFTAPETMSIRVL